MSLRSTSRLFVSSAVGLAALFTVAAGGTRAPQQAADAFTFLPITLPDNFFPIFVSPLPTGWGDLNLGQQAFADINNRQVGSFTVEGTTVVIQKAFPLPQLAELHDGPWSAVLGPDRNLWGTYGGAFPHIVYRCDAAGRVASFDLAASCGVGCFIVPSVDGSQAGPFVYVMSYAGDGLVVKFPTTDPLTPTIITLPSGFFPIECMVFRSKVYCAGTGGFMTIDETGIPGLTELPQYPPPGYATAVTGTADGNLLFGDRLESQLLETTTSGSVVNSYSIPDPPIGQGVAHIERLADGRYLFSEGVNSQVVDYVLFDKDAGTFSRATLPGSAYSYIGGFGGSGQTDYRAFVAGLNQTGTSVVLFGVPSTSGPVAPLLDTPIRAILPSDLAPRSP